MRRGRVRGPRPADLRPGHRAPQLRRAAHQGRAARGLPRQRPAHASPLGPHPGTAVLRPDGRRRRHDRRVRPRASSGPARRRVRRRDAPAVLPDPARGAPGLRRLPGSRARRLRAQRREGAHTLGAPHRPHARVPHRDGGRLGRVPPRPRAGHGSRRPRRLHPARRARPVRRRRPPHPRRAAHHRRVRDEAQLGPLHDRVRDPRGAGSRCARARAVPPLPVTRRRQA